MAHVWDDNVLGGTGKPRLVACSNNLCTNAYFNEDLTTWDSDANVVLSREETDYAYGQYMVHADYTSGGTYFWCEVDTGASILADAEFIAVFRVNADYNYKVKFQSNSIDFSTEVTLVATSATRNADLLVVTGQAPSNTGSQFLRLVFDGYSISSPSENLYIDNVFISPILGDYTFPYPQETSLNFEDYSNGRTVLWNNLTQRFDKKYIPVYAAKWISEYSGYERYRQLLHQAPNVVVVPHSDVNFGFVAYAVGDLERRYSFDRYLSHELVVELRGQTYLYEIPVALSGSLKYT